jgi:sulfite reductase alpha subunit-like flavoprotein
MEGVERKRREESERQAALSAVAARGFDELTSRLFQKAITVLTNAARDGNQKPIVIFTDNDDGEAEKVLKKLSESLEKEGIYSWVLYHENDEGQDLVVCLFTQEQAKTFGWYYSSYSHA